MARRRSEAPPAAARAAAAVEPARALEPSQDLALGYALILPLLAGYELAVRALGGAERNTSELLASAGLRVFGAWSDALRWGLLAALALAALVLLHRRERALVPAALRVGGEAVLCALCLGPLLVLALRALPAELRALALDLDVPADLPRLPRVGLVCGGGAWEELVFRLGAYSALYWLGARALDVLGAGPRVQRALCELLGLYGSAALFAAFHLAACNAWLGAGGESFHAPLFAWRVLAGLGLGILYRWRGLGVAAWTHALFNAALLLGAGPGVLVGS